MPMSDYMRKLRAKVGRQLLAVPSVSIVVVDERGYVVLVKHSETGDWVTPGGAIEPNEIPSDAAVREAWEETGLHARGAIERPHAPRRGERRGCISPQHMGTAADRLIAPPPKGQASPKGSRA